MESMQNLRISSSLNLYPYQKDDLTEYIRQGLSFYKEAGFDAADFPMNLINFIDEDWMSHIEKAAEAADEIGINFEICHLPFGVNAATNPDLLIAFNERMHNAIDAAVALGVDYAVLHPNVVTVPMSEFERKEQFDIVCRHLSPFAEHAAKVNLKIALENMRIVHSHIPSHRYCQDPDELCNVTDALGFDVCWDFGHAHICGLDHFDALSYVGRRLKVVHINDNNGIGDDHLPPFYGNIDWKNAMKALSHNGFDGLFNYEIGAKNIPAPLRESLVHYLIEASKELMTY